MAPVPPFSEFQVGWICALKAEFEAATLMLDEEYGHPEVTPPNDSNMYLLGRIGKHNVVVTLLAKFGTTTSAVSISNMIRTFSSGLRFALMVGIGGGIPAPPAVDIRLADVVVGYPNGASPGVVQYDMLKQTLSGSERIGALNNPPPLLLSFAQAVTAGRAKHRYLEHVQRALEIDDGEYMETMGRPGPRTDRLFEAEYDHPDGQLNCDRCLPEREIHRDPRKNGRPRVHYGTIASGNSVIKNAARREELRVLAGGALCFEMEAAGMVSEFPCLVIRGICDYADSHKHKAWQGYAALVAASFTKELLLRVSAEGVAQQELIVKVLAHLEDVREDVKGIKALSQRALKQAEQNREADEEEKRQKAHQVFKTSSYEKHKDSYPRAVEGTCQWVCNSPEYIAWRYCRDPMSSRPLNVLLVSADPYHGKSVLARHLVDTQLRMHRPSESVCYFFFGSEDGRDNLATAMCAILHQLFQQQPGLRENALPSTGAYGQSVQRDTAELWRIFEKAVLDSEAETIVVVFDALHECDSKDRDLLIAKVKILCETGDARARLFRKKHLDEEKEKENPPATVKFLFTSRRDTQLERSLQDQLSGYAEFVEGSKSQFGDEVDIVVRARLKELAKREQVSDAKQQEFEAHLLQQKPRTYRWLNLALDSIAAALQDVFDADEVVLASLPVSMDAVYKRMLEQVSLGVRSKVSNALQIMLAARYPLSLEEMAMAMGIAAWGSSKGTTARTRVPLDKLRQKLPEWCESLITINKNKVEFIDPTVKECLLNNGIPFNQPQDGSSIATSAEALMAEICIRYLAMEDFPALRRSTHRNFVDYAVVNWADHWKHAPPSKRAAMEGLIDTIYSGGQFNGWAYYYWDIVNDHMVPFPLRSIHVAALNDHDDVIERMLSENEDLIDATDDRGTTALILSAWRGHLQTSKLLLRLGADVNAVSTTYGTPLLIGASEGNEEMVNFLLENNADVNYRLDEPPRRYREPPYYEIPAFEIRPYVAGQTGRVLGTALAAAYLSRHFKIATILLQHGASDLDLALMAASCGGHLEAIRDLIVKGANPKALDNTGFFGTTVQAAALGGHSEALNLLLDLGAKDATGYGHFDCALQIAARRGNSEFLRILLNHEGSCGYGPEHYFRAFRAASYNGMVVEDVQILARKVPDVDRRLEDDTTTALDHASQMGHTAVVRFFLERGADPNPPNPDKDLWRIPLIAAAHQGHSENVELLLEHGADVNAVSDQGDALRAAILGHHCSVAKILIKHNINVNTLYNNQHARDLAFDVGAFDISEEIRKSPGYIMAPGGRYMTPRQWANNMPLADTN